MIRSRPFLALLLLGCSAQAFSLSPRELDQIPLHVLPAAAVEHVRQSLPEEATRRPPMLALTVPTSLGLEEGTWSVDGDEAVWRARLYSSGASLLIAHFDLLELPDRAELHFMDAAAMVVQGPYTAANLSEGGELWTGMVPGEEALIEIRTPVDVRTSVRLHLAEIGHGVMPGAAGSSPSSGVTPKSGSCNIDVACSQGDAWRPQIRSAVRLQIPAGGGFISLCSGQMMNNSAQDDRPLVLTAHHCGITAANVAGVVAYFNYETSSCGGAPNGVLTQTLNGAQRLFSNASSDHTLFTLAGTPPAAFNAYLSGFNASAAAVPQSGASVHHPSGDEKRISLYSTPAVRTTVCLSNGTGLPDPGCTFGTNVQAFRVTWSQGVTEGGSSGGGLWNQAAQLVGVLSGGASSCASPGQPDAYGRLDVAWGQGIAAFLDPAGSGTSLAGKAFGGSGGGGAGGGGGGGGTGGGSSGGSGGGGGGAFGAGLGLILLLGLRVWIRCRGCRDS